MRRVLVRWWVLSSPDGRVYTTMYALPSGPVDRARLDDTMRQVLGTIRFKERRFQR